MALNWPTDCCPPQTVLEGFDNRSKQCNANQCAMDVLIRTNCFPFTDRSQTQAIAIDEELMGPEYGFSVDQLMEIAGEERNCCTIHDEWIAHSACHIRPCSQELVV